LASVEQKPKKDVARDYRIAAIDRAISVLEELAERPGQGVSEIARRLGMNKSLVFRILQTLEARGYVARRHDLPQYRLGYRTSVLGERSSRQDALLMAAGAEMDRLRDATSENVNLLVRDGMRALVLATRESRHSMRLFAQAGRYGPLHAGGGSTLLLAFAPESLREAVLNGPLPRYTEHTVTDPAALREVIRTIRARRWHLARSDLDDGAFSIAAPIRGAGGEVVAAISVAGALSRLDAERRRAHLAAVWAAAARISERLGAPPLEAAPAQAGTGATRACLSGLPSRNQNSKQRFD